MPTTSLKDKPHREAIRSNEISSFICNFPFSHLKHIFFDAERERNSLPSVVSLKICSVTRKDWSPLTLYFAFCIQFFSFSVDVNAYFNLIFFRYICFGSTKKLLIFSRQKNCTIKLITVKHFFFVAIFGLPSKKYWRQLPWEKPAQYQIHHFSHKHNSEIFYESNIKETTADQIKVLAHLTPFVEFLFGRLNGFGLTLKRWITEVIPSCTSLSSVNGDHVTVNQKRLPCNHSLNIIAYVKFLNSPKHIIKHLRNLTQPFQQFWSLPCSYQK